MSAKKPSAAEDPNRRADGRWARGNKASERLGLWAKGVPAEYRPAVGRVRAELVRAGLPADLARSLAIGWSNAARVVAYYSALTDEERLIELFPTFDRALQLQLHVLRQRDKAAGKDDSGDDGDPLWKQAARAKAAGGDS